MMPPASPAANMGMAGTSLSDGLSYCQDLSRDVDRRNSAQSERSQICYHDRKLYRHGSRDRENIALISRVLGIELSVIDRGLILGRWVRRIFVLVRDIAKMIQKGGRGCVGGTP